MNKNMDAMKMTGRLGRAGLAALALLAAPMMAKAAGSCGNASSGLKALETQRVESEAQYWASLMEQPGFAVSQDNLPGSDISDPNLKKLFYTRLSYWLKQEEPPQAARQALKTLNDVSQTISLVKGLCS
jgi:hypothetical protein